jgi:hypothetical protein
MMLPSVKEPSMRLTYSVRLRLLRLECSVLRLKVRLRCLLRRLLRACHPS